MKKHYRHEHDCLNCGSQLQGKFCHNCGQENLQIKESFGHMLNHAVSDYFHFDHQFFHTLNPLLFKPGKLTIEYMAGRRAQYLHPVKMYIFISLVFFLLILKSGHEIVHVNENGNQVKKDIARDVKKDLDKNKNLSEKEKKQITNNVKAVVPGSSTSVTVNKNHAPVNITEGEADSGETYTQYLIKQQKLPADERDGIWERFFKKAKFGYTEKYGKHAMEQFQEDLKHNVPKMMFVLLPLFALILKVAFLNNKKYYVEHLIFAIHLHCFFFLFIAFVMLIQLCLPQSWHALYDILNLFVFFISVWYTYRALRVVYLRSRWRTISKLIGMSMMYWLVFCFCLVGLILATAATI